MALALEPAELTAQLARLVGFLTAHAGGGPAGVHELSHELLAPYKHSVARALAAGDAVTALHLLGGTAERPVSKPVQTALVELLALRPHHAGPDEEALPALPALLGALHTDYVSELAAAGEALGVVRLVGGPGGCPLVDEAAMQLLEESSGRQASAEARLAAWWGRDAAQAQAQAQAQERRLAAYAAWHVGSRGGSCWRRNVRRRMQRLCGSRALAEGVLELLEWQGVLRRAGKGKRRLALCCQAAPRGRGRGGAELAAE
jgi:hypothetical protein